MATNTARIELPRKMLWLFAGKARYRVAHGGRGSGKTRSFALMTAVKAYQSSMNGESGVILCCREFMNSLADSSMEEVKQAIRSVPFLAAHFDLGENYIRTKDRRVSYSFCGLRHNLDSIKSKARILLCWVDEAESVSDIAWQKLDPTVREEGSELYISYNPERDGSPTDKRFRKTKSKSIRCVEMNYTDNPWFPDVLDVVRCDDMSRLDQATYDWIWNGAYRENSDAQILNGKYRVEEFAPGDNWDGPYFGVDWGFSQDPTAGVKCWIHDRKLYIEYEACKVALENDDIAGFMIKKLPGIEKHVVYADAARPETISHVRQKGAHNRACLPRLTAAEKWPNSVEDGIAHLRSYQDIVIHPRCTMTLEEARMWSYKTDRLTGDVLPTLVSGSDHIWDSVRYALSKIIRRETKSAGMFLPPRLLGNLQYGK